MYLLMTLSTKCYCTDAASRKRSHDEESEGGPAVKKPASDSHGEFIYLYFTLYITCALYRLVQLRIVF